MLTPMLHFLEKFLDNPIPFDNKAVVPKAI